MEILESLKNSPVVKSFTILDFKSFENGFYIKINTILTDNSILAIKEYSDFSERNYSYHLMDFENNFTARWDNSPHHKSIPTFPHHKHTKNSIIENKAISLNEILVEIENHYLKKR